MSKNEQMVGISRRTLVKSTAIGSLALAAGGFSLPFTLRSAEAAVQQANEKVVWGACSVNCGSRCALRMHVKDNEVTWVETDNTGSDEYGNHQVRACLRGRSIRRRINHPDRLNYPMKRVGKRGEGKFERISWDEALDTIASSLKKTVKQYGNEAVYIQYSSGIVGGNMTRSSPSASAVKRLMNCYGGSLNQYGSYSTAQISCAMPYTYGSNDGNSTTDIENSKLVVMFGNNPAETRMSGGGITYLLEKAREKSNAKMIVIDPRYTDTAAGREDEWLPIRPGTDAALVAGIAWVLINENLVDQPFLDKYCVGYDEKTLPADAPKNGHYKAYILGEGDDKTAKTPQWASQITGIPVDRIIKLAREIGTAKPAYICQGWGPQRQANGELTARAIAMLPILTGNVGISGGNSGARESTYTITIERLPVLDNPVKTSISCFSWTDAIDHGPQMTAIRDGVRGKDKLDVPIKFIWNYAGNTLVNQHSDINKTHEILQDESKCEMIVVIENFMTSSAKYADILLPDLMTVEQEDIIPNDYAGNMGYLIFLQPVTSEKFERKPIYWILSEVAKRLGPDVYQKFTEGRTQEQWLQHLYAKMLAKDPALPSYDELKKMGIYKRKLWWLVAVIGKMPQALGKLWLLVSMALGIIFVWMMTCVYQIDTVPTWHNGYTTLAFFLTVLLSGPILAATILRAARVTFNTTPFAIISILALIACAGLIVLQGLSLASIHSSVQQASALVPDYASLQVWRVVLLCAGLGCWLCPLIRRREPHVAGLVLGLILILGGEMIGRVLFYGLHMTVGMAIAG